MPTGKILQIEIEPSCSTIDLKRKITQSLLETQEQTYEPHQQILSLSGALLEDAAQLSAYNIQQNSIIDVTISFFQDLIAFAKEENMLKQAKQQKEQKMVKLQQKLGLVSQEIGALDTKISHVQEKSEKLKSASFLLWKSIQQYNPTGGSPNMAPGPAPPTISPTLSPSQAPAPTHTGPVLEQQGLLTPPQVLPSRLTGPPCGRLISPPLTPPLTLPLQIPSHKTSPVPSIRTTPPPTPPTPTTSASETPKKAVQNVSRIPPSPQQPFLAAVAQEDESTPNEEPMKLDEPEPERVEKEEETSEPEWNPSASKKFEKPHGHPRLPAATIAVFRQWLLNNLHSPYPSMEEKDELAAKSGASLTQVNNWFTNARRRVLKDLTEKDSTAPPPPGVPPLLPPPTKVHPSPTLPKQTTPPPPASSKAASAVAKQTSKPKKQGEEAIVDDPPAAPPAVAPPKKKLKENLALKRKVVPEPVEEDGERDEAISLRNSGTAPSPPAKGKQLIGRQVKVDFDGKLWSGIVRSYDKGPDTYSVYFFKDDKDVTDLKMEELEVQPL